MSLGIGGVFEQESEQEWDQGESTLVDNALRRFVRHYNQREELQEQMAEGRRASEKVSFEGQARVCRS